MAVVPLDRQAARAAISAAAGRFTALLRDTDDIERPAAGHQLDRRRNRGPCVLHVHRVQRRLSALTLSELTVHGYDIATGTGRPWPISAEHAKLILGTVCPEMLPLVVRPEAGRGAPVTYEVRLRGDGPRYVIRVADGTAEVRAAAGGPVDCVISADPVTFLMVAYGRMPLGRALLRGGMLAWGRRPWLALRFKGLFFNP